MATSRRVHRLTGHKRSSDDHPIPMGSRMPVETAKFQAYLESMVRNGEVRADINDTWDEVTRRGRAARGLPVT